jgi:hypothetical protein
MSPRARAQRGEPDLAQPLYEHALAVYEAALGPDHAEVAHTLTDLAVLHLEQARGPARQWALVPAYAGRASCVPCVARPPAPSGCYRRPSAPASCIGMVGMLCGVLQPPHPPHLIHVHCEQRRGASSIPHTQAPAS